VFSPTLEEWAGRLYDEHGKTVAFLALACLAALINAAWLALTAYETVGRTSGGHDDDDQRMRLLDNGSDKLDRSHCAETSGTFNKSTASMDAPRTHNE